MENRPVVENEETKNAVETMINACHNRAYNNGWWHDPVSGEPVQRSVGDLLCLIHSEISEGFESYRRNRKDAHLPQYEGLHVELADAVIRIFDMAGGLGIDLSTIIVDKLTYNDNRADHKRGNRAAEGGKKL